MFRDVSAWFHDEIGYFQNYRENRRKSFQTGLCILITGKLNCFIFFHKIFNGEKFEEIYEKFTHYFSYYYARFIAWLTFFFSMTIGAKIFPTYLGRFMKIQSIKIWFFERNDLEWNTKQLFFRPFALSYLFLEKKKKLIGRLTVDFLLAKCEGFDLRFEQFMGSNVGAWECLMLMVLIDFPIFLKSWMRVGD